MEDVSRRQPEIVICDPGIIDETCDGCEEQSQVVHKKMSTDAINLIRPSSIEVHAFVARQNQHAAAVRLRQEDFLCWESENFEGFGRILGEPVGGLLFLLRRLAL